MTEESAAAKAAEAVQRVRDAIKRSGKSQAYLAKRLHMPASQLSKLLSEGRNLKLPLLTRIAGICGLRIEELLGPAPAEPEPLLVSVVTTEAAEREGRPLSTEELAGLTGAVLQQLRTVYEELQARSAAERAH